MSENETALAVTQQPPMPVHLVATNPVEMEASQKDLKAWLEKKIESLDVDIVDFNRTINVARENKWNTSGMVRLRNKAVDSQEFYAKVLAAVEAGFTIIPDFPVDIFAIRVERELPSGDTDTSTKRAYVSPVPEVDDYSAMRSDGKGGAEQYWRRNPMAFQDVVFPLRAARVEVMNATSEAMARKIFDQIGICPAERKADPLIIGQILCKKRSGTQKRVGFLIAWHLNLNEL